jgi:NitT/TauT family transport system substrate-binding protein
MGPRIDERKFAAGLAREARMAGFARWYSRCALASAMVVAAMASARALEKVNVATTVSITDLSFLIAQSRGYFRDEGLDVDFVSFDSAARAITSLASGELDVVSGGPSAGLYNAMARGVGARIVADKTHTERGRHSQIVLVRKALVDSGRFKSLPDIKGLKIANAGPGSSAMGTLNRIFLKTGLKLSDIERVYLGFPQQITALQNGAIDIAFPTEPMASEAVRLGIGVAFMNDDEIYPDHEIAVIVYSDRFRTARREAALAFMRGYLRAVRAQNESIVGGRLAGKDAEEFIDLIVDHTPVKDRDLIRSINLSVTDGDGKLKIDSLKEDFEVYRAEGLIEGKVSVDEVVDQSFARAAVEALAKTPK